VGLGTCGVLGSVQKNLGSARKRQRGSIVYEGLTGLIVKSKLEGGGAEAQVRGEIKNLRCFTANKDVFGP